MIYGIAENPRPTGKCVKYYPHLLGVNDLHILFFSSLTMRTSEKICPICCEDLDISDVAELRQKGADGINSASMQRG